MKAISYIKKNSMLLLAGAAIIGFSSFKLAEKFAAPQSGWYQVTPDPTDPEDKSLQVIGAFVSTAAPSGACDPENNPSDKPCQILLNLTNFTASSPEHMTVEEAIDTYQASIDLASGGNNDGYAREENR